MDWAPSATSAATIANAIALSVSNIDDPSTELNAIAGATKGELRLCYQTVAGNDSWTLYAWDNASSTAESVPYTVDGSSGMWTAIAGKYVNGAHNINAAVMIAGQLTVSGAVGLAAAVSTTAMVNVAATNVLTGSVQHGLVTDFRAASTATGTVRAGFFRGGTTAAVFTADLVAGVNIGNTVVGSGSTVTKGIGAHITKQTSSTNNYNIACSNNPAVSGNWCIYDDSTYASTLSGPLLVGTTTDDGSSKLQVAGNISIPTTGSTIKIAEGTNAKMGRATLVSGTVTVSTTGVLATSEIFLSRLIAGGTLGHVAVGTRSSGTSFIVSSTSTTETSTFAWLIVDAN